MPFYSPSKPVLRKISVREIRPNPHQPRRSFDEESLLSLADSISRYGVLQPLTVQKSGGGYLLIAGERRLRASVMAGLSEVPCIVTEATPEQSSLLALVENLQREDLHYLDEAAAISRLIRQYHLSQEEAAKKLGRSQSAVANKLRLLRLSPACTELLRQHKLSERHARALLMLEDEEMRLHALRHIAENGLTVSESEQYIQELLTRARQTPPRRRPTYIIKDVRIFLNSVNRSVRLIREAGVSADCSREDTENEILLTIRIPKSAGSVSS